MRFHKYHALGNDYVVLDPADYPGWGRPGEPEVRAICHRNYGVGSDGILWGPLPSARADFALRIFNPDGSEAEKSGNGLRIFARFLWDTARAGAGVIQLETPGGVVRAEVRDGGAAVRAAMGRVSFDSRAIPVAGTAREVIGESIEAQGRRFTFCAATIGNPHCVIQVEEPTAELARRYGPEIEVHPLFPNRTNVQFMRVLDRSSVRIEIWERGAGYTLASGTSSSACAAVAHRLGLVDRAVAVRMPGGTIEVELGADYAVTITGPVTRVADGEIHRGIFAAGLRGPPLST